MCQEHVQVDKYREYEGKGELKQYFDDVPFAFIIPDQPELSDDQQRIDDERAGSQGQRAVQAQRVVYTGYGLSLIHIQMCIRDSF